MGIIEKIFGTHSENELKRIYPIVDRIEAMEPEMKALSDEELKGKTREFKERLSEGESLDDLLPEALCSCTGSGIQSPRNAPLQSSAHRWYHPASGPYCRDEDW